MDGKDFLQNPRIFWDELVPTIVIALLAAGFCIWFVAAVWSGGGPRAGNGLLHETRPPPQWASWETSADAIVFVVVSRYLADEVSADLAAETRMRARMGEKPRNAQVLSAADEGQAEVLAGVINDQANMAGVS